MLTLTSCGSVKWVNIPANRLHYDYYNEPYHYYPYSLYPYYWRPYYYYPERKIYVPVYPSTPNRPAEVIKPRRQNPRRKSPNAENK